MTKGKRRSRVFLSPHHRHRKSYHTDEDCPHLSHLETCEIIRVDVDELSGYTECTNCNGDGRYPGRIHATFEHIDIEDLPVLENAP